MKYLFARVFFYLWRFSTLILTVRLFKTVKSPTILKRSLFGGVICLDVSRSITQQLLYLEGERLIDERFLIKKLVQGKVRIIDIGANIGYYLLMLAQSADRNAKIICIEPSAENLPELNATMKANPNIDSELYFCAVGRVKQKCSLSHGLNGNVRQGESEGMTIQVSPLDELIQGSVDFVKIDVEGYEYEVLQGAEKVLNSYKPTLFLELHPKGLFEYGSSVRECIDFLGKIYPKMEFYVMDKIEFERNLVKKMIFRVKRSYFGCDLISQMSQEDALNFSEERVNSFNTLWCVCRND